MELGKPEKIIEAPAPLDVPTVPDPQEPPKAPNKTPKKPEKVPA